MSYRVPKMRGNYEIGLVGQTCVLVPYRREHVPKYHEWMKDPVLLEATGSEPLSLEDEYSMQLSWRDDPDKCTFIILSLDHISRPLGEETLSLEESKHFFSDQDSSMVGDVNLFFSDEELQEGEHQDLPHSQSESFRQAEIDIMVAEKGFQRKGIGREACCMIMLFVVSTMRVRRFFCKINDGNSASLALFERLGFIKCGYAECFKQTELELRLETPDRMAEKLRDTLGMEQLQTIHLPSFDEAESKRETY